MTFGLANYNKRIFKKIDSPLKHDQPKRLRVFLAWPIIMIHAYMAIKYYNAHTYTQKQLKFACQFVYNRKCLN